MKSFSQIAKSITYLLKNGVKLIWSEKCEDSFRLLKEFLIRAPMLKLPSAEKYYVVCANASLEGVGGV